MRRRAWWAVSFLVASACSGSNGGSSSSSGDGTGTNMSPSTGDDGGTVQPGRGNDGNGGDGSGDGNAAADAGSDGGELCQQLTVRAKPTIPEMLIILDKSASMVWVGCDKADDATKLALNCPKAPAPYDKPFDRWAPSVSAVKRITSSLQDRISFGLMIFPNETGGADSGSTDVCQPGNVRVEPALNTANAIAQALDAEMPDGTSTPTAGTLKAALDYLGPSLVDPDNPQPPRYVLLVTDGGPNCTTGGEPYQPPLLPGFPSNPSIEQCQMDAYTQMDALTKQDVQSYVIGYDTAKVPELAAVLDELAKRGGTGDTMHRPVENEDSLLKAFEGIAGKIASCTYELDDDPKDPKYVRVTLDGKDLPLGDTGWQLVGKTSIELKGDACAKLQDGTTNHQLSIKVECEPVIIK